MIPSTEISYGIRCNQKYVSWATKEEKIPLLLALEQFADVCEGYFPRKDELPTLEEYKGKDATTYQNQKIILDESGDLTAIIAFDENWENPTLDCINATSADFYALLEFINKEKIAKIGKNKVLRKFLHRI